VRERVPLVLCQYGQWVGVRTTGIVDDDEDVQIRDARMLHASELVHGVDCLLLREAMDDLVEHAVVEGAIPGSRQVDQPEVGTTHHVPLHETRRDTRGS
jgi:hypothetical protein